MEISLKFEISKIENRNENELIIEKTELLQNYYLKTEIHGNEQK
jgi:hypothetical protein